MKNILRLNGQGDVYKPQGFALGQSKKTETSPERAEPHEFSEDEKITRSTIFAVTNWLLWRWQPEQRAPTENGRL